MGAWFSGNGPWVPMELLDGYPGCWDGEILVPSAYLTSWSLSPAVAFRCGEDFNWALGQMLPDAALFHERQILACMGSRGKFVADPVIAGYWIHHGGNESYKQHADQPRQTEVFVAWLDGLLDSMVTNRDWRDLFQLWAMEMPIHYVTSWLQVLAALPTRHKAELETIMQRSLQGRCEFIPVPVAPDPYQEIAGNLWPATGIAPTTGSEVAA